MENLQSAVGSMAVGAEEARGKTWEARREETSKMEEVELVMVGVAEDRFDFLEEAVVNLHEMEVAVGVGLLAVNILGLEAGGQSDLVGVEGLEQRGWTLAEEGGTPVCQVEEVEVHQLQLSETRCEHYNPAVREAAGSREVDEAWGSPDWFTSLLTASIPPFCSMTL